MTPFGIGLWEEHLVLTLSDDEARAAEGLRMEVLVDGRKVMFFPSKRGVSLRPSPNLGWPFSFEFRLNTTLELRNPEFCRFMLHPVEVRYDPDDESLMWDVPADHLLPWPALDKHPQWEPLARVARRELGHRARSAVQHGYPLKELVRSVPTWVRGCLTPTEWSALLSGEIVAPRRRVAA